MEACVSHVLLCDILIGISKPCHGLWLSSWSAYRNRLAINTCLEFYFPMPSCLPSLNRVLQLLTSAVKTFRYPTLGHLFMANDKSGNFIVSSNYKPDMEVKMCINWPNHKYLKSGPNSWPTFHNSLMNGAQWWSV